MTAVLQIDRLKHRHIQNGKELSFALNWGECLQLIGDNGSGKSTLLLWLREQLKEHSPTYLPQQGDREFFIPLQLNDVMQLSRQYQKLALTENLELSRAWNSSSGGEKQRVLLDIVCDERKKIWLLDEPFNHLDKTTTDRLLERIHSYLEKNGTVVMSSHKICSFSNTRTVKLVP